MDKGDSSQFLKFTRDEAINKISLALKSEYNSKIYIWRIKDGRYQDRPSVFNNLKDFKLDTVGPLKIKFPIFLMSLSSFNFPEKIILTINFGLFVYIAESTIQNNAQEWLVEINSDLFRQEDRENERFITYPHHKSYAYFLIPVMKSNVIFFKQEENRAHEINNNYLKTMQKKLWEKLVSETSLKYDNEKNVLELRISDLSLGGFSVLANNEEREALKETRASVAVLSLNSYCFELNKLEMIYSIPFVDQKALTNHSVVWDKVGFKILEKNENLENMLSHYLTEKIETETRIDFLKYIKGACH